MADMSGLWRTSHRDEGQLPKLNVVGSSPITRSTQPLAVAGVRTAPFDGAIGRSGPCATLVPATVAVGRRSAAIMGFKMGVLLVAPARCIHCSKFVAKGGIVEVSGL